jgi:hypothetical protein
VMQCIFERSCEHRDRVRPEDFLLAIHGNPNGQFRYTLAMHTFQPAAKLACRNN